MTNEHSAHALEHVQVFDTEGHPVRLGTLWADRAVMLVFVRHFGCLFCREQIAALAPIVDRVRNAHAGLFIVGNGTVEEARVFRQNEGLTLPLLTDPSREAYCALGMRHGSGTLVAPPVIARGLRALLRGFRQTRTAGDPRQQGGVVVIDRDGVERYRYISRWAGDHPDPADAARTCEALG